MKNCPRVILISTDTHTMGIQAVGRMLLDNLRFEATMYYLPANVSQYPQSIRRRILTHITSNLDSDQVTIIAFSVKELNKTRTLQLAEAIRKQKSAKRIILVAGGTYATACPDELLSHFDYVVVGGGEGLLEIVTSLAQNREDYLEKIIFKAPSRFYRPLFSDSTWVLDNSGNLKRTRLRPLVHPQYEHAECLEIMFSSGCDGSCSFCEVSMLRRLFPSYKLFEGSIVRMIELIKKEIMLNPRIDYVYLFDEDFLLKPERRIREFCTLFKNNIALPFFIFATPYSVLRCPDKLRLLTKAGLDTVNLGIQTGSERIARRIFNRREDRNQASKAVELLVSLYRQDETSSPPMVDFIILNPYEDIQDLKKTFSLIKKLPTPFYAAMHSMTFFKGTPLYHVASTEEKLPPKYRSKYNLHNFVSRLMNNELSVDYRLKKNRRWLLWNIILYEMNGLHYLDNAERIFGNLTLHRIEDIVNSFESGKLSSLGQLLNLARGFPNPMRRVFYPWELKRVPAHSSWTPQFSTETEHCGKYSLASHGIISAVRQKKVVSQMR